MKLDKGQWNLLKEARRAIAAGKYAVAAAYLADLPKTAAVIGTQKHLRDVRADRQNYMDMSRDEQDAHDNIG
jgi:hypothetical protein